jgi:hypothetical protein
VEHTHTILTSVTLASTNNALPEDGVTLPKHVGATNYKTNYLHHCIVLKTFYTLKPSTHIKINFKITPTCFGPIGPSSGSTSFLSQSYHCGSAAACCRRTLIEKVLYSRCVLGKSSTCTICVVVSTGYFLVNTCSCDKKTAGQPEILGHQKWLAASY